MRLPSLTADGSTWRLPLADASAAVLVEAVLLEDDQQRRECLSVLLQEDPSLMLWVIARADSLDGSQLKTAVVAARWLAAHLPSGLTWENEDLAQQQPAGEALTQQWGDLVSSGVAAARTVEALAAQHDQAAIQQASLLALVHGACQWLCLAGPTVTLDDSRSQVGCLPAWLGEWLREMARDNHQRSPAAALAAEALELLAGKGPRHEAASIELAEHTSHGKKMRSHWLSAASGAGRLLPLLTKKLARSAQLENEFHRQLLVEKLASLKEFSYGAGHEINNPLTNISGRAQTLLREETDPERRRRLATIHSHAMRAHEMIAEMALIGRPPNVKLQSFDVIEFIDGLIEELTPEFREQGATLRRGGSSGPLVISADPTQLTVALRAMCVNSLQACERSPRGGQVEIEAGHCGSSNGSQRHAWFEIVVRDNGPGLDKRERRHLFDPFFSGREAGRGLGFGLSKVWQIVNAHGGRIDVESEPDLGTTLTIRLPVGEEARLAVAGTTTSE